MRNTHTCPKCAGQKIFVIGKLKQAEPGSKTSHPMPVTSDTVSVAWWSSRHVKAGHIEAWVCAGCGFMEWYAKDANEVLAYMAQHADTGVVYLDGGAPTGPYR